MHCTITYSSDYAFVKWNPESGGYVGARVLLTELPRFLKSRELEEKELG